MNSSVSVFSQEEFSSAAPALCCPCRATATGRDRRAPSPQHKCHSPSSRVSKLCGLAACKFNFSTKYKHLLLFLNFAAGYFCKLFGWVKSTFETVENITLPCRFYHPTHGPTPFHCWWLQGKADFRSRQSESNTSQSISKDAKENHSREITPQHHSQSEIISLGP